MISKAVTLLRVSNKTKASKEIKIRVKHNEKGELSEYF